MVVEFAVGVLVLIFLMLATVEIGRAYYSYNTLTKAVQTGVRHLASNAASGAGVVDLTDPTLINETKNLVVGGSLAAGGTTLLPNFSPNDISMYETTAPSGVVNPYVRLVASYQYTPLISSMPSLGETNPTFSFTMAAGATMRVLR